MPKQVRNENFWAIAENGGPENASCRRQHCDLGCSCPALRPLMLFSALRPGMFFAGIATADEPWRMSVSNLLFLVSYLLTEITGRDSGN